MPLPENAHYERGSKQKWVILSDGARVRKSMALNIGAKGMGFRNNYQYEKFLRDVKKSGLYQHHKNRLMNHLKNDGTSLKGIQKAMWDFNRREAQLMLQRRNGLPVDYLTPDSLGYKHMKGLGFTLVNGNWQS